MRMAHFVYRPRTITDLKEKQLLTEPRPFVIVAEVVLPAIDYENFLTDMLADRQFIEDSAPLTATGIFMKCLHVYSPRSIDGILVVADYPKASSFVLWAAYCGILEAPEAPVEANFLQ